MASTSSEKKTITGSCHCGFIKYTCTASLDPSTPGQCSLHATRCNCTFCQKLRTTNFSIEKPYSANFTLLSPASRDEVAVYAPRVKTLPRHFCHTCGVHVWMEGYFEFEGQRVELFMVNLATVDQPQEGVDLSTTKITYWDGLRDNFQAGLQEKPWPNGLV